VIARFQPSHVELHRALVFGATLFLHENGHHASHLHLPALADGAGLYSPLRRGKLQSAT